MLNRFIVLLAVCFSSAALAEDEGNGTLLTAVANAKWKTECSACHIAYPPMLLPERSWRKLMVGLDKHFGVNAGLDDASAKEITEFLVSQSADHVQSRRAQGIARSIAPGVTPLRITETAFFKREHNEVRAEVWKRPKVKSPANCSACHTGAEQGDFSEDRVRIPK
jgi:hypothetical protein